ncbi:MAG: hypothetical protein FWF86_02195 [Clostridia bacterium]|nr:hypothetical protein [Clostridia bacterium]
MKRIQLSRLLCFAMAALLPLAALAESPDSSWMDRAWEEGKQIVTTFTVTPGELLATETAVTDLFNAAALSILGQKDNFGSLALLLNGKEVLTLNGESREQGLYVQSELFGDTMLYLDWDGLQALLENMMEGAAPGASAGFSSQFKTFRDALSGKLPSMEAAPQTPEEAKAMILQVYAEDEAMVSWINGLMDRMIVTEGEFTGPDHDPATQKFELLITQDDIAAIMDTQYMKDLITPQLRSGSPGLTEEELQVQVEKALAEGKEAISNSSIQIPITELANEGVLVSVEIPIVVEIKEQTWDIEKNEFTEISDTAMMPIQYCRLTAEDVTKHTFSFIGETGGAVVFSLRGVCNEIDEKHWDFSGDLMADATEVNLKGSCTTESNADILDFTLAVSGADMFRLGLLLQDSGEAYDVQVDLYVTPALLGMNLDASSLGSAKPLVSLNTHTTVQEPDGRFEAFRTATPETSKELMKMSPDEWNNYGMEINTNVTKVLYAVMAELPTSVLTLVAPALFD